MLIKGRVSSPHLLRVELAVKVAKPAALAKGDNRDAQVEVAEEATAEFGTLMTPMAAAAPRDRQAAQETQEQDLVRVG